jgi:hypothetical protein
MRVVVAVDGEEDLPVVEHGIVLARENNARLELIGGIPRLWFTSAYALDCARLEHDLKLYAAQVLRTATELVGDDVCLTIRQVQGRAADHLLTRHDDALGDLLLIRGCRRLSARPRRRRHRVGTLLRIPVPRRVPAAAEPA